MTGLQVASWNIHKGVGNDRRRDLARTAAVIGEIAPDIMALQEADSRFGTRRGLLDMASMARDHGLLAVTVPEAGVAHGWHGNVLLLRKAVVEDVHRVTLPGLEPRGALITDLRIADRPLRVIAVHLGLLPWSRTAQTRALTTVLAQMDVAPCPADGRSERLACGHQRSASSGPAFPRMCGCPQLSRPPSAGVTGPHHGLGSRPPVGRNGAQQPARPPRLRPSAGQGPAGLGIGKCWCPHTDLNRRPSDYKSDALPTEL